MFNQSDLPDVMPPQMIGVPTGGGDYVKSNFSKTFPSEWVAVRGRGSVDILWARSREKEIHRKKDKSEEKRHRKVGKIKRKDDNIKRKVVYIKRKVRKIKRTF